MQVQTICTISETAGVSVRWDAVLATFLKNNPSFAMA